MVKKENNIYLISIIAIVAIVGIVALTTNYAGVSTTLKSSDKVDLAGQAIKSLTTKPINPIPIKTDDVYFQVSGNDIDLTYTNKAGDKYSVEIYSSFGDNLVWGAEIIIGDTNNLNTNDIFIVEEDGRISRFLQMKRGNAEDDVVEFKDLGTGEYYEFSSGETLLNSGIILTIIDDDTVQISERTKNYIYTKTGVKLSFDVAKVTVTEPGADIFMASVGYDDTDDEPVVDAPSMGWTGTSVFSDDGNIETGKDSYGTSFIHDAENHLSLKLSFPLKAVLSTR